MPTTSGCFRLRPRRTRCVGGSASSAWPIGRRARSTAHGSPRAQSSLTTASAHSGGAGAGGARGALRWQLNESSRGQGAGRPMRHGGGAAEQGSCSDCKLCARTRKSALGVCPGQTHRRRSHRSGEGGEHGALPQGPHVHDGGDSLRSWLQGASAPCMLASAHGWSWPPRAAPRTTSSAGRERPYGAGRRGGTLR